MRGGSESPAKGTSSPPEKRLGAWRTELGFGITDVTRIVTATSELARNVLSYGGSGEMKWKSLDMGTNVGIELVFEDHGQGIANVELAMQEGFSTSNGLGLGLPGSKRLMDQMEVVSEVGKGTTVTVRKFRKT